MKKVLLCALLWIASSLALCAEVAQSLPIPSKVEIALAADSVNADGTLTETKAQWQRDTLLKAYELISSCQDTLSDLEDLKAKLSDPQSALDSRREAWRQAQALEALSDEQIKNGLQEELADAAALEGRLAELASSILEAQSTLQDAQDDLLKLQTLPSTAFLTLASADARIKELTAKIDDEDLDEDSVLCRVLRLEIEKLKNDIALSELKLEHQALLEDLKDYEVRAASSKLAYLTRCHLLLQELLLESAKSAAPSAPDARFDGLGFLPKLEDLRHALQEQLALNSDLSLQLHEIENSKASLEQIEKNLAYQDENPGSSLVLSRLLNEERAKIPAVDSDFDAQRLIANLSLDLYETRRLRSRLLDSAQSANDLMAERPQLQDSYEDLKAFLELLKIDLDSLYQAQNTGLAAALALQERAAQYDEFSTRVQNAINDKLFWLSSNNSLGLSFLLALPQTISSQLDDFAVTLKTPGFLQETLWSILTLIVPVMLLGGLVRLLYPKLKALDTKIALNLDTRYDTLSATPLALLLSLIAVIPKLAAWMSAGGIIIIVLLPERTEQLSALAMLSFHVTIFSFLLEISKPNGLMRRHFALSPALARNRHALVNKIYAALLPILLVANIRELDPSKISSDTIGFAIMLFCSLCLSVLLLKGAGEELKKHDFALREWFKAPAILFLCLILLAALALGYYYTAIKLINRTAFSVYTCLAFILVSQTLKRIMHVAHQKLQRRVGLRLRPELAGLKLLKFINLALGAVTVYLVYLQWNDLTGVLSYLDTIYLWKSEEPVGGELVISSYLSVADVLLCLLILALAVLLNRTVPPLLERAVLLRFAGSFKKSSYTVRIISSYLIIALGIILSGRALGIGWDNLQWLVAALSVGLGFGLQEIFGNFVSGLIILFERQLRVGDIITINGMSGTVSKITIRSTTIVSFDHKDVMIPNKAFITSALTNWSLSGKAAKLSLTAAIASGDEAERAKEILYDVILGCRYLAPQTKVSLYLKSVSAGTYTLCAELYVDKVENLQSAFDDLCARSARRFEQKGIKYTAISSA